MSLGLAFSPFDSRRSISNRNATPKAGVAFRWGRLRDDLRTFLAVEAIELPDLFAQNQSADQRMVGT